MKETLDHLSRTEQASIRRIVRLIHKATPRSEMIILFGSNVDTNQKGDALSAPSAELRTGSGVSKGEYDILVVVKNKEMEDKILKNIMPTLVNTIQKDINRKNIIAPVNIQVESIDFVNEKLAENDPVYSEITETGIILFATERFELGVLPPVAATKPD